MDLICYTGEEQIPQAVRNTVTYSLSQTVPITTACRNHCRYCGYWSSDPSAISLEQAEALLAAGKRGGCREALILSGERPWELPGFSLDERRFIDLVYSICLRALRLGLLPHSNVGTLSFESLERLRSVNASMGLMLETVNDSLPAHHPDGRAGKRCGDRLRHIADAGRLRIPFTTGILVGIGESREDRLQALEAIASVHEEYGHIQEVIVQNFRPKQGTPMATWHEPPLEVLVDAVEQAHRLMPGVPIQVPPNLNRGRCRPLLSAGATDLGGISSNGDLVNPESLNPDVRTLAREIGPMGYRLLERLPVHPRVAAELGPPADTLRRELVGDTVTYVVNCNVNFTNVCTGTCRFCAFHRGPRHPEAFTMSLIHVMEKVRAGVERGATEVCIQGGLNAALDLCYYTGMIQGIKAAFPDLHIHAFSPMEIFSLAERHGTSPRDLLARLKDAGLDSMPGTAAEILVDEVRDRICPTKLRTAQWVDIVSAAHRLGIRTTATIMFGHIETWEHRIRHLEVLRNIQRDTGGFTEFILLPFLPGRTPLARQFGLQPPPLEDTLKLTAYARLYFGRDLVHIQNSWVKLGVRGAQETLRHGANDFGGTLMEENISRTAGAAHGQYLSPHQIEAAIRACGRVPVQRDTLYRRVAGPEPGAVGHEQFAHTRP